MQLIEDHKFGDWFCCFVEDGVGGAHNLDKKWVLSLVKHPFLLWEFASLDIYVCCSNFNSHGVGRMPITCGTWFLSAKALKLFRWECCNIGEHYVDTQGFPPCCTTPSWLSF